MRKVEVSVLKPWIAKKLVELMGFEDDVLIEYVGGMLEDPNNIVRYTSSRFPEPPADSVGVDCGRQEDASPPDWVLGGQDPDVHERSLGAPPLCPVEPSPRTRRVAGGEEEGAQGA